MIRGDLVTHISEREVDLPDAVIGKLLRIAVEDKNIISLGPGEPDFDMAEPIVNYVKEVAGKSNHYSPPGGRIELREAIVKKLKKDNNINANPDNVIVTCGSQEAMLLATACTLDVSEQVIIPNPSFLGYLPTFELFNAFPVALQLKPEEDWAINPDELKKLIDKKKTKVILINSPANPTGNVLSKKLLEEIADIAIENDVYVFSDEAYEKLIYGKKHFSIGSLNGMKNHVVTFQTFSKSYAMCGFRVGYAVGPTPLIEAMKKIHIYSTLCAPTISQMAATKALSLPSKYIDKMVSEYNRRRKMIVKGLNEIGLKTVNPNGAFYTFSDVSHLDSDSYKFSFDLMRHGKVAVVPGKEFGRFGEGYIRCSYATDYTLIKKALGQMGKFVRKYK